MKNLVTPNLFLWLVSFSLGLFTQTINAQDSPPPLKIPVQFSDEEIILDGELSEDFWKSAERMDGFSQYFPSDTASACAGTEMYVAYDDDYIYLAAKCYAPGNDFIVSSLKRDYGFRNTDNISFLLDTYSDKTNCYLFGMNAFGARREALISNGGKTRDSFDASWDNKWKGESKQYDGYWICELAIPLKILKFQEGDKNWRFNAYRNDTQCNEISTWTNIPREYVLMDMNYMGELDWENPLKKQGRNISIIPYASGGITRDFEDNQQQKPDTRYSFGGDAKVALSTNLNIDLTVNPDFSQVEVDRQITDLNRFEIFFPERRQFFLENADLFSRFGNGRVNPFFSRRIGIGRDTTTGNTIQNTIYGGVRLAGKINDRLRVGLLTMQTAAQVDNDLPSYNFTVAAAEQQVFDRSGIAFIFVNKEAFDTEGFGTTNDFYDRVMGLEYRLRSKNNYWTGKASIMRSFNPGTAPNEYAQLASIEYNKPRYRIELAQVLVGSGFDAETGFVPRKDLLLISPEFDIRFFPQSAKIVQHSISVDTRWFYKLGQDDNLIITDFGLEEFGTLLRWNATFTDNSRVNARINYNQITLLDNFDPTRIQEDDIFLDAGSKHQNKQVFVNYSSDSRKAVYWEIGQGYGQFYGGTRLRTNGRVTYRYLPYGSFSLSVDYNHIDLGGSFETADLWLIGPRFDITFTKNHFLTTFVQYNNQLKNVGINTRFQWRFAPASDFFIVYTDNYSTDPLDDLSSRNRGIIAKLTYWLNL